MTFWNIFWGVLAGIVAGTTINLIVNFISKFVKEKNRKKNFNFEIEYNISAIEKLDTELEKFKDHVATDSLQSYFGYFALSKILSFNINSMFQDGSVYKHLKNEEVASLMDFFSEFSLAWENQINAQMKWNRENFLQQGVKQLAMRDYNFWKKKFGDHKKTMKKIKLTD